MPKFSSSEFSVTKEKDESRAGSGNKFIFTSADLLLRTGDTQGGEGVEPVVFDNFDEEFFLPYLRLGYWNEDDGVANSLDVNAKGLLGRPLQTVAPTLLGILLMLVLHVLIVPLVRQVSTLLLQLILFHDVEAGCNGGVETDCCLHG